MAIRRKTVLAVVDEDLAVRNAMTRLLSVLGYHVQCYASAGAFLTDAATSNADCLLVDIAPRDMSGLDMVRKLTASGSRRPVIFMTGSGSEAVRARAEALNCKDYLLKPIPVAQLIAAIERAAGLNSRIG